MCAGSFPSSEKKWNRYDPIRSTVGMVEAYHAPGTARGIFGTTKLLISPTLDFDDLEFKASIGINVTSHPIQHINKLPETPVLAAIEAEGNSRQIQKVVVIPFFGRGIDPLDFRTRNNVGEVLIQARNRRIGRRKFQPDHEKIADKTGRMKVAIEPRNPFHRLIGVVRELVEK